MTLTQFGKEVIVESDRLLARDYSISGMRCRSNHFSPGLQPGQLSFPYGHYFMGNKKSQHERIKQLRSQEDISERYILIIKDLSLEVEMGEKRKCYSLMVFMNRHVHKGIDYIIVHPELFSLYPKNNSELDVYILDKPQTVSVKDIFASGEVWTSRYIADLLMLVPVRVGLSMAQMFSEYNRSLETRTDHAT